MAAEVNLDPGREPSEMIDPIPFEGQVRGLGEVHLRGHREHPRILDRPVEHQDGRRVPRERPIGKGIHHGDPLGHGGDFQGGSNRGARIKGQDSDRVEKVRPIPAGWAASVSKTLSMQ